MRVLAVGIDKEPVWELSQGIEAPRGWDPGIDPPDLGIGRRQKRRIQPQNRKRRRSRTTEKGPQKVSTEQVASSKRFAAASHAGQPELAMKVPGALCNIREPCRANPFRKLPHIHVCIKGETFQALLDTGATASPMHKDLARGLRCKVRNLRNLPRLTGVTGAPVRTYGYIHEMIIPVAEWKGTQSFFVTDTQQRLILGFDFCNDYI